MFNATDSGVATSISIINSVVSLVAVISTVFICWYSTKKNTQNLKINMEQQSKNIYLQINQGEIIQSLKELAEAVSGGNVEEIKKSLITEATSVYIPTELKGNIELMLEGESGDLKSEKTEKILARIREFLYGHFTFDINS
jgi:hypothetical protein